MVNFFKKTAKVKFKFPQQQAAFVAGALGLTINLTDTLATTLDIEIEKEQLKKAIGILRHTTEGVVIYSLDGSSLSIQDNSFEDIWELVTKHSIEPKQPPHRW